MTAVANKPGGELLQGFGLRVQFEGVTALDGVDIALEQGEILGLIGPNGAGKTTLINVLTGFQAPTEGRVVLGGEDVTGRSSHRIARRGLARTFQGVRLFPALTVRENVQAAALAGGMSKRKSNVLVSELLDRMGVEDRADARADSLPYGIERRVGIARAMALRPRFVLLDEPAAGLNEEESDELSAAIEEVRSHFGVGLLVIEHDMRFVMGLCDRVHVLDYGETLAIGVPSEIAANPEVIRAYLGGDTSDHDPPPAGGASA